MLYFTLDITYPKTRVGMQEAEEATKRQVKIIALNIVKNDTDTGLQFDSRIYVQNRDIFDSRSNQMIRYHCFENSGCKNVVIHTFKS